MDLFALAAKITLDSEDYEKGLEKAKGLWGGFTSAVKTGYAGIETGAKAFTASSKAIINAMEGISSVGDAAIKTMGGVSAAVGTAAAAMGKLSIDQYADYEQLVGGVETLFNKAGMSWYDYSRQLKEAGELTVDNVTEMYAAYEKMAEGAQIVLKNAADAYKTAGLSENEYMETVTSISASLLQSLEDDTVAAAKKADMAITDMADNANKMGTSMEMIQNAYQGFAKQNYTMLDNLNTMGALVA